MYTVFSPPVFAAWLRYGVMYLLALLLSGAALAQAVPTVVLDGRHPTVNLSPQLEYLVDPSHTLSIEQLTAKEGVQNFV